MKCCTRIGILVFAAACAHDTTAPVAAGDAVRTVSLGYEHSCAITAGGTTYCWGNAGEGMLGFDTTVVSVGTPTAVQAPVHFASISVGWTHACAMGVDGVAYCWGSNDNDELGDQTRISRAAPRPVTGGHAFTSVVSGSSHTCGLTADGNTYCWGLDELDPEAPLDPLPRLVAGGVHFTSIVAGGDFDCGLVADGAAYCWGSNKFGELGIGNDTAGANNRSSTPLAVEGGLKFASITAGARHACGLTSTGVAYCWGFNGFGEIGTGQPLPPTDANSIPIGNPSVPVPTPVAGAHVFRRIMSRREFTCGLTTDGTTYCWGENMGDNLGNVMRSQSTPVLIEGPAFTDLFVGDDHGCGLTASHALYCWGTNVRGEVGTGGGATPVPLLVRFPLQISR